MENKQKSSLKNKMLVGIVFLIFLFSALKAGIILAQEDSVIITDVQVTSKSDTVDLNSYTFENSKIINNVVFHNVGDSITYKVKVKNNDTKNYIIKSVGVDNTNDYISYSCGNYKGTKLDSKEEIYIEITETYANELTDITNRNQSFPININFVLEEEEKEDQTNTTNTTNTANTINTTNTANTSNTTNTTDITDTTNTTYTTNTTTNTITNNTENENTTETQNTVNKPEDKETVKNVSLNPKTGDDVIIYVAISILSLAILIILTKKTNTKGKHSTKIMSLLLLGIITIPSIVKAQTNYNIVFTIENTISLQDKLVFTYEINGEQQEKTVKYGEKVTLENPTKQGYNFIEWQKEDGTPFDFNTEIKADEKVIAKFELITYTIGYELNDGKLETSNLSNYTIESEDITLNNPKKDGYTFDGWTGSNGTTPQLEVKIAKGSTGAKNYTANYTANSNTKYTVIHELMNVDGRTYAPKAEIEGYGTTDTNVTPDTNTYEHFKAPEKQTVKIKGDGSTTVTYKYKRDKYNITFTDAEYIDGNPVSGEYYYEAEIQLKAKEKAGHTFEKWSNGETSENITYKVTGEASIGPVYKINEYTVSFDTKGGTEVASIKRNYNTAIGTLPETTKANQVFVGWFTDETYAEQVTPTTKVIDTVTYVAKWRDLENYTIEFDSQGGTEFSPINVIEGNTVGELPAPTKDNYKFRGWYTDKNYTTKIESTTKPTASTTYFAKWVDKMSTVFSIEGPVQFKGKSENLSGNVPSQYLGSDGKYIDTNIALFNNTNYDKDFEIGFTINSYNPSNQDEPDDKGKTQFAFFNTKYENGAGVCKGTVFRVYETDTTKYEIVASTSSSAKKVFDYRDVTSVKIFRIGKEIYYSINGKEKIYLTDKYLTDTNSDKYHPTTLTFGASEKVGGLPFRHIKATLSNMYIKLEQDD